MRQRQQHIKHKEHKRRLAIRNPAQSEAAIKELQQAGVDMKSLSIAGKNTHTDEHVVGYYNAGDLMKYWGKMGAFWG
jgi:hypothetical protein